MNRRLDGSAAPLPNVCVHESAHAVVAWALGIRVKGIHLLDGGGRTEVVHLFDEKVVTGSRLKEPDHLPVRAHFVRELAVCFAGSMASA